MGSMSGSKSTDKSQDITADYRRPAWDEALNQITNYLYGGLPTFQSPSSAELSALYSLTPTEQASLTSMESLAKQGYVTPAQETAGAVSTRNLGTTLEDAMLSDLTKEQEDYLTSTIESLYGGLYSEPIGSTDYMQTLTGEAWGDLTTESQAESDLVTEATLAQSAYEDLLQQAELESAVTQLQTAGAQGVSRSLGAMPQLEAMQYALPMYQLPYDLQLEQSMKELGWSQDYSSLQNSLWQLAMQMMGASPIQSETENISFGGSGGYSGQGLG